MRTTKLALAGLACACACLSQVTLASAAPTAELGRCLPVEGVKEGKKTVHHGAYANKQCTKPSATKSGKFEWNPGPGAAKALEAISVGTIVFETASGRKIECTKWQTFGEYTGVKSEKLKWDFSGCKDNALQKPCQSLIAEGGKAPEGVIESQQLIAELGAVAGTKPAAGWDTKPETGSVVASFECGATLTGTKVLLEGSVIGALKPTGKMTEEVRQQFKASKGVQMPEHFEGGAADVLGAKFIAGLEVTTEPIGLTGIEEVTSEEPLEYRITG